MQLAALPSGQRLANTGNDPGGSIPRDHPDDYPAEMLQQFQPTDVPGVLPAIAAVLLAVIFDRYFDVFPAHVQIRNCVREFVEYRNLCLRSR